jgi:rhodanese-related sulfurtransferase
MEKTFEERVAEAKSEVASVTPHEANECRELDPDTLFIDPRSISDIQSTTGLIPGAVNITLEQLSEASNDALPMELESRSRTIITACQGGPMGALAAYALKQHGYTNVHFIDGGTQAWLDAGYTTVR